MDNIIKRVSNIHFGLLRPDELKQKGIKITSPDLYDKNDIPYTGGLFDQRLGTLKKNSNCKTCNNNYEKCPGHLGYIELNTPVYYPHFIKYIKQILNCVCLTCSSILLPEDSDVRDKILQMKNLKNRLVLLSSTVNKNRKNTTKYCKCYVCDRENYMVIKDKVKLCFKNSDNEKIYLKTSKVLNILSNISDNDIEYLGMNKDFSRPEWMICTVLAVPPPCARPTVVFGPNNKSEDDLTFKLVDIIRSNNSLKNILEKYERNVTSKKLSDVELTKENKIVEIHVNYVEFHVFTYFNNNMKSIPSSRHKNGRPLKTLKERFIGKEGLVRQNLIGKRVNFSARSVVSPEPLIDIDQLGVPFKICMKLTYPETVNKWNINKLRKLIENGPDKYPGARFIIKNSGIRRDIRFIKLDRFNLEYGDIVERHLLFDDVVLFNRQPSLHKFSMMGHRVKPMNGNSFRLNPNVANPYNADFDGDEMNMHICLSVATETELREIAMVSKNIITPQSNKPVIGFIMDTVIGSYLLTQKDKLLTKEHVYVLLSTIENLDIEIPPPVSVDNLGRPLWSGRDLMTLIIPKINIKRSGNQGSEDVKILRGKLLSGVFDKKIVGSSSGGLIHMITNDINPETTKDFMGRGQRLINHWLKHEGFSVGFSDMILGENQNQQIKSVINNARLAVDKFIDLHIKKRKKISKDDFENKIFGLLNDARDQAGKISMNSLDNNNSLYAMVNSGSKGNFINISQITASVGQQNVQYGTKSGRIPFLYNYRTLPHFQKYDVSADARGFVSNCYLNGLTPTEFFFHTQSGREGLIDTAVKTAETGYIQRKLMKSMEDLKVAYDMTVRNEFGNIVQFVYGGDGFNAKYIEKQGLEFLEYNTKTFDKIYKWNDNTKLNKESKKFVQEEYKTLLNARKLFRKLGFYKNDFYCPINVNRILKQSKQEFEDNNSELLTLEYYIKVMKELLNNIYLTTDKSSVSRKISNNALYKLKILIQSKINSKRLIKEYNITKTEFDWIIQRIYDKFYKAVINPGENVGAIAAQSISEPTTQLSVGYSTNVVYRLDNKIHSQQIGLLIDDLMEVNDDKEILVDITESGKSSVINFPEGINFEVPSVDTNGKVKWSEVTQVSRHPPNGKMVKVITESGREVISTMSHTFLVKNKDNKIESMKGSDLKIDMEIPIMNKQLEHDNTYYNKRMSEVLYNNMSTDNYTKKNRDSLESLLEFVSHSGLTDLLELS